MIGSIYGSTGPVVRHAPNEEAVHLIRLWVRRASKNLGLPGLPLVVRFSFTQDLPLEVVGRTTLSGTIRLNIRDWKDMSRRARRRLIIHELCHSSWRSSSTGASLVTASCSRAL